MKFVEDPASRLLLTVLDGTGTLPLTRCPGCDFKRVRVSATPGLMRAAGVAESDEYCMNDKCVRALALMGVLRKLKECLR